MSWKGPYEDGITQSLINRFLECPYRFYIYAMLGLEENRPQEPNLVYGDSGHKGLELLIEQPEISADFTPEIWEHIDSEVDKHLEQYIPFPPSFPYSIKRMLRCYDDTYKVDREKFETERKFAIKYNTGKHKVVLRGKLDGVNSTTIVEHKFKGKLAQEQTREEVPVDLQVNMYTIAYQEFFDTNELPEIIYDVIRVPDTQFYLPQRRMRQSISNWVEELYTTNNTGDFPIEKKRGLWLDQAMIYLQPDVHEKFKKTTLHPLIHLICKWWDHVHSDNFDPEDPECHNEVFYRVPVRHFNPSNTENYKCNYHGYLTGTLDLSDLSPVKTYYPELEVPKETL